MRRFERKVALVTAAAQGIGQAIVRRVAAEGGAVVVTGLEASWPCGHRRLARVCAPDPGRPRRTHHA
jgi:NAD(P)-dependent dehydrogenase (short-subunit alcohol dehydrogenase family)